jgi:hypothetical protein
MSRQASLFPVSILATGLRPLAPRSSNGKSDVSCFPENQCRQLLTLHVTSQSEDVIRTERELGKVQADVQQIHSHSLTAVVFHILKR